MVDKSNVADGLTTLACNDHYGIVCDFMPYHVMRDEHDQDRIEMEDHTFTVSSCFIDIAPNRWLSG